MSIIASKNERAEYYATSYKIVKDKDGNDVEIIDKTESETFLLSQKASLAKQLEVLNEKMSSINDKLAQIQALKQQS